MIVSKKTCPNCKTHQLSLQECMTADDTYPSECPKCHELYVITTGSTLLAVLVTSALVLTAHIGFGYRIAFDSLADIGYLIVVFMVFCYARAVFAKPIRYADFKPYGKRSWWMNVFIFGVVPICLILLMCFLLVYFKVGS